VPWLMHICAMTHSYVCHDSFICVPWLIHKCDINHSYTIHVTWLIHMYVIARDVTHKHNTHTHNPHTHINWNRIGLSNPRLPHIWMSHVTHMNESCHTYEWVMSHIWMSHVRDVTHKHNTHTYTTHTHINRNRIGTFNPRLPAKYA